MENLIEVKINIQETYFYNLDTSYIYLADKKTKLFQVQGAALIRKLEEVEQLTILRAIVNSYKKGRKDAEKDMWK